MRLIRLSTFSAKTCRFGFRLEQPCVDAPSAMASKLDSLLWNYSILAIGGDLVNTMRMRLVGERAGVWFPFPLSSFTFQLFFCFW